MGPWLIFATLINKATITLYEGAPTTRRFLEFIQNSCTTILGVVPSIIKAWRANDLAQDLDLSHIKLFSSTGEASNPDDMLWLSRMGQDHKELAHNTTKNIANNKPIIEYCGGTEIAGGYVTSTIIQPLLPSTFSTPALGLDFYLLDTNGVDATGYGQDSNSSGEVAIVPPSLGLSTELLNQDHYQVYYAGMPKLHNKILRRHGDALARLANGYYRPLGRIDDTMKLGGIKVSSAEIELALSGIHNISEVAAIGVDPSDGGPTQLVIYAVVTKDFGAAIIDSGKTSDALSLMHLMQQRLSSSLNPLFKIHKVVLLDALPRTSSNQVMRRVLREQYAKTG
jgi:acetyl-CoA synthetase